jgi:hypothetical protein
VQAHRHLTYCADFTGIAENRRPEYTICASVIKLKKVQFAALMIKKDCDVEAIITPLWMPILKALFDGSMQIERTHLSANLHRLRVYILDDDA